MQSGTARRRATECSFRLLVVASHALPLMPENRATQSPPPKTSGQSAGHTPTRPSSQIATTAITDPNAIHAPIAESKTAWASKPTTMRIDTAKSRRTRDLVPDPEPRLAPADASAAVA
jgi:hypothetical protein